LIGIYLPDRRACKYVAHLAGMIGVAAELIPHGAMKWSRERSNDNGI
jgi:hypothetical protein